MMMMMMMMCRNVNLLLVLKEMMKSLVFFHPFSRKFAVLKNGKNMYTDEVRRRRKTKSFKSGK